MKKSILLLTSAFILIFTMSSCAEKLKFPNYGHFGFKESETVIEVDETVTSFRIEGEHTADTDKRYFSEPRVYLDTYETTAKHSVHFINVSDFNDNVVPFIVSEGRKVYHEVRIIPKNITEEVNIVYYSRSSNDQIITETTIILRPKKVN